MHNKQTIFILISASLISFNNLQAQNGLDTYQQKDSTYRFTTSQRQINSLFSLHFGRSRRDTSYCNSFRKAEVINLSQLLYLRVNKDPDLTVMQSRIDAPRVQAKEKGYLPGPMLEAETDVVMSDFSWAGMIIFYASQMFPFPGKLRLDSEQAVRSKDMPGYEKPAMASMKKSRVKQSCYDLYFNIRKLRINDDNRQLVTTFITAAECKYSVGKGMQQEVFKRQIELSRLTNEKFVLKQQRRNNNQDLTKLTKTVTDDRTAISFSEIGTEYNIL